MPMPEGPLFLKAAFHFSAMISKACRLCVLFVKKMLSTTRSPGQVVLIVTAGTSDLPVADEAAETCAALGVAARRLSDVGVAGGFDLLPRTVGRTFPDDYTLIAYRGKPAADGPRYRALGNSMAVPVIRLHKGVAVPRLGREWG